MATEKIQDVLRHFIDLEVLVKELEKVVGLDNIETSKILYLGGEQNVGCVITKTSTNEYITKLSIGSNREHYFYQYIYPMYIKNFKKIAKLISPFLTQMSINNTDIHAIVMNKITGSEVKLLEQLNEISHLNRSYSSAKFRNFSENYPFDDFEHEFILFHPTDPKNPITALHSFSSIHIQDVNKSLFKQINKHFKKMKYRDSVNLFQKLEQLILRKEIHKKIDPFVNYSIQHGDFYKHNLIQSKESVYCIDWGCARIGPITADMAGLLGRMKIPFDIIQKEYLDHSRSNHLTNLDKALFIYILMITWLIVYDKIQLDKIAVTDLKNAMSKLNSYIIS